MLATLIIAYVVVAVIFLGSLALAAGRPIPEINPADLMDQSLFTTATGVQLEKEMEPEPHPAVAEKFHPAIG